MKRRDFSQRTSNCCLRLLTYVIYIDCQELYVYDFHPVIVKRFLHEKYENMFTNSCLKLFPATFERSWRNIKLSGVVLPHHLSATHILFPLIIVTKENFYFSLRVPFRNIRNFINIQQISQICLLLNFKYENISICFID